MTRKLMFTSTVLTVTMTAAHAANDLAPDDYSFETPAYHYNEAIDACGNSVPIGCLKKQFDEAEQELAIIYKGRFTYNDNKSWANGLRTAQQAWVIDRKMNCSWLSDGRLNDIYYRCMLDASINRKYWLLRNIGD